MMRLLSARRRDIVCRDAVALVTDYLEGALSSRDRARLERHLASCDGCEEYLRQMRATIDLLGNVEPEDLEPAARAAIVELLIGYRSEEPDRLDGLDDPDGPDDPDDLDGHGGVGQGDQSDL